ncbi:unnamed protein product [Citrullus colocynthis]|uniref:Uncharacterized protein n=1 Tax=Citrullus colocynthis TaxID=252529 RepID=A0ABP0YSH2_9ROSI
MFCDWSLNILSYVSIPIPNLTNHILNNGYGFSSLNFYETLIIETSLQFPEKRPHSAFCNYSHGYFLI